MSHIGGKKLIAQMSMFVIIMLCDLIRWKFDTIPLRYVLKFVIMRSSDLQLFDQLGNLQQGCRTNNLMNQFLYRTKIPQRCIQHYASTLVLIKIIVWAKTS